MLVWKHVIGWALALYLLSFLVYLVVGSMSVYIMVSPAIILIASYFYFRANDASLKRGFLLGASFLVFGILIDMVFFITYFLIKQPAGAQSIWHAYNSWIYYIAFLEVLLIPALVGFAKQHGAEFV